MTKTAVQRSKIEIKSQLFKLPEILGKAFCTPPKIAALSTAGFSSFLTSAGVGCTWSNDSKLEIDCPTA